MTVSVIIPVWNRYKLTEACVRRILRCEPVTEIVVVDNGSTDETKDFPVSVRNSENLGFAKACNQGAEVARGTALIFLNNDTLVHPGWTRIAAHTEDPSIGCVGARLLYPDNTIQHAGVGVDFTRPWGLEAFNLVEDWTDQLSDVDGVTGACLAIRRELFFELGCFDEGFWNGYEDVDLCLSALAAGKSNLYDPRAVVTHYESQSGEERWTAVSDNISRLRQKWSNGR